jgi:hypothetical protein
MRRTVSNLNNVPKNNTIKKLSVGNLNLVIRYRGKIGDLVDASIDHKPFYLTAL